MKKILLFLLFSATVAWTQPRGEGPAMLPPPDDGPMIDNMIMPPIEDELLLPGDEMTRTGFAGRRIVEKLNLTSEQEKQFGKLQSDMQKEQIDLHSKMQSLRIDLRDLFREDNPDQGKIESKLEEVNTLQGKIRKDHVDFWFNVNKILTADQQKIWKEHRTMLGGGFGMRGDSGIRHGGERHFNTHRRGQGHHRNMQEYPKSQNK